MNFILYGSLTEKHTFVFATKLCFIFKVYHQGELCSPCADFVVYPLARQGMAILCVTERKFLLLVLTVRPLLLNAHDNCAYNRCKILSMNSNSRGIYPALWGLGLSPTSRKTAKARAFALLAK